MLSFMFCLIYTKQNPLERQTKGTGREEKNSEIALLLVKYIQGEVLNFL